MTERLYWKEPWVAVAGATVRATGRDGTGEYFVLDRTPLYPQGGGQPADRGVVRRGERAWAVRDVRNVEGELRHYADGATELDRDAAVVVSVDRARRELHARLHTAGHWLAQIVERHWPGLRAVKAYHFPEGPYVELEGEDTPTEAEIAARLAEAPADAAVEASLENDSLRTIAIGGYAPVPCGGTHVPTLAAIGRVVVKAPQRRGSRLRVRYSVEEPATLCSTGGFRWTEDCGVSRG